MIESCNNCEQFSLKVKLPYEAPATVPSSTVVDLQGIPPLKDAGHIVDLARKKFLQGKTKDLNFRKKQLKGIQKFLEENKQEIAQVIYNDLKRPEAEIFYYDTGFCLMEVQNQLNCLEKYGKPEKISKKRMANVFDECWIYREPYGVVLIIGPWNYPLQLILYPLLGAIAAGNAVVIKPSDLAPNTATFLYETLPKYIDKEVYPIYLGGVEETTTLLEKQFDYIFFTGSFEIGKIVHQAANRYLTPVTLELGGKSPVYIDDITDIELATKRILWGKLINTGQTCIAPDYILCSKEVQEKFLICAEKVLKDFYRGDPQKSESFGRIINNKHFIRLTNLLIGARIAIGGRYDLKERYIEPTILRDVRMDDPIMKNEIFGPILPIITVENINEAIEIINEGEKPLALYIFSKNKRNIEFILQKTSSGGVCVNDTIMQATIDTLPFGGVGSSGIGAYHGKSSFDLFSHKKAVLKRGFGRLPEALQYFRYPPYSQKKIWMYVNGARTNYRIPNGCNKYFFIFLLGVILTLICCYIYVNFRKI